MDEHFDPTLAVKLLNPKPLARWLVVACRCLGPVHCNALLLMKPLLSTLMPMWDRQDMQLRALFEQTKVCAVVPGCAFPCGQT